MLSLAACRDDPAPTPQVEPEPEPAPVEQAAPATPGEDALAEVAAEAQAAAGLTGDGEPAPRPGVVAGEVHSESGRARVCERVYLVRRDVVEGGFRTARVDWELDEAPAVGRFVFEDVPDGTYELSGEATVEGFAWEREALELEAPAEGLQLRLLDAGTRAWIELDAVGQDTNRPMPGLTLVVAGDLPGEAPRTFSGDGSVSAGLQRADPGLRWRLVARGHLPAQGGLEDLEPRGERDGHPVLGRSLDLVPGWTVRLQVRHGWLAPLPGARVSVDDELVGRTDAQGQLDLRRDRPPRVLRVFAEGFRPATLFGVDGMQGDPTDLGAPPVIDLELKRR